MPARKWTPFALLAATTLLTACVGAGSSAPVSALPTEVVYSRTFQDRAAAEREAMAPRCDRIEPADDCSAAARLIDDYGDLRRQLRAAR